MNLIEEIKRARRVGTPLIAKCVQCGAIIYAVAYFKDGDPVCSQACAAAPREVERDGE